MTNLTLLALLFPLLGFIVLGLLGRTIPRRAITTVALGACGLAFLCAAISFFSMLATHTASRTSDQVIYTWVVSGDFQLSFGQLFDPLSAVMLMVVTGVGFIIHVYSAGYMEDDPGYWRFFAYMNFFIFAMVLLVSSDNFLFMLVGWGLVGLASFLLIGFWYQRPSAVAAAKKALVINIIGDFGFMLAIFLIFKDFGTLNFLSNGNGVGVFGQLAANKSTNTICLLLFVACAAKSAQLPLYMWLPDAMEGPTPVSALIHAATMVTAGVYLVARANPLFELASTTLNIVAGIGGLTALFAATIAVFQLDIKRVLAYSTISQLGYMFMAEGVHNYSAGILHLTTHAYFKALLFLGAGAVIHALGGEQDMRKMGGLRHKLPTTFLTFVIAALAISGIPPLSGFWSKDEILGSLLAQGRPFAYFLWALGIITAGLTAFYMFRLVFGIFAGTYRGTALARADISNPSALDQPAVGVSAECSGAHLNPSRPSALDQPTVGADVSRPSPIDRLDEDVRHAEQPVEEHAIHEAPRIMSIPLIILAIFSVIGGFVGSFALFGASNYHPLASFLSPVFAGVHTTEGSIAIQWVSTVLSVGVGVLGIWGAWTLYRNGFLYKENKNPFYQLVLHKYYVDEILTAVFIEPLLEIGRVATRWLEGGLLDGGSRGVARVLRGTSSLLRRLQTGYMRNYALAILVGVVLIILFYAVRG